MECPICGKESEDLVITEYEADFDDLADHVFRALIEKGYVVSYDNINMILDIIHNYMMEFGAYDNDENECS